MKRYKTTILATCSSVLCDTWPGLRIPSGKLGWLTKSGKFWKQLGGKWNKTHQRRQYILPYVSGTWRPASQPDRSGRETISKYSSRPETPGLARGMSPNVSADLSLMVCQGEICKLSQKTWVSSSGKETPQNAPTDVSLQVWQRDKLYICQHTCVSRQRAPWKE